MSATTWPGPEAREGQLRRGVVAVQPEAGALTTRADCAGDAASSASRANGTGSPSSAARSAVRLATRTRAPARAQREHHRPRRAAGADHQRARAPSSSSGACSSSARRKPGRVGVVGPEAPRRRRARACWPPRSPRPPRTPTSSTRSRPRLWGIVTFRPAQPAAARPRTASGTRSGGTGKAAYSQLSPSAREGRVVHRRRQRVLDGPADDAGDPGAAVDHPAALAARLRATSCSNCAGVREK